MALRSGSRVLFVTDTWHPQINGVVKVVERLKEEIEKRGVVVEIMEPSQFFTVPFPLYPEFRLALFARKNIRERIRSGAYDEVNIHTYGPVALYARAACIRYGKKFSMTFHNQLHLYAEVRFGVQARKLVEKLLHWFYAPAALTLVTTPTARKELLGFGLSRVAVWPLGVEEEFFIRGVCPRPLEKPVFAYLGRVAPEKNIEEFLSAKLPGTKIVIGDGPDKKKLEREYPHVLFLGYRKGKELIAWLCCADVLVMPSRTDTFGLVVIEALALGIPVAAHDAMGPRDIIENGVNGCLDEDIARAAKKCLELSPEACRASAKKYTWSASADTYLSLAGPETKKS
jgi:glycosyltransferase involved in cell wall biosynthesis